MKNTVLGLCLGLIMAFAQAGDVLSLKAAYPQTYVVKKGDTLWDISSMFLNDPWFWPELWYENPQVQNPHLIYPGDILKLMWVNGKPVLVRNAGPENSVVKLTPEMRISDITDAIDAIPLNVIGPFLTRSRVVSDAELERAPYVLAGKRGNIVAGAGDQVLGRGDFSKDQTYGVYRRGQVYQDPITGEVLGVEAIDIGTANLLATDKDISTLSLNRSTQEIRRADRFLPMEVRHLHARFEPKPPVANSNGFIIAVEGGLTQIGSLDVVTLNLGDRDRLEAGDVLAIYSTGEMISDPVTNERIKAPDMRSGVLMVFRSFERLSYALVLKAEQPLKVGDLVTSP